ncbi:PAX3- and PAX7-binding protein 1 [Protopterus annectens]|uniref:PAX3- and PAX7-binding protein 1 n=1 Tax=Protopterus annectens TaxID=7888 RepID=UPI001CFA2A62|nr:PAX3- and PAX7-binding protein 1 [Protopterus annectens]
MFKKVRRVNVRRRNASEDEENEESTSANKDSGVGTETVIPPVFSMAAVAACFGVESTIVNNTNNASFIPQGNGVIANVNKPKDKKKPKEEKEIPKASLLSFQDEEEGELACFLFFCFKMMSLWVSNGLSLWNSFYYGHNLLAKSSSRRSYSEILSINFFIPTTAFGDVYLETKSAQLALSPHWLLLDYGSRVNDTSNVFKPISTYVPMLHPVLETFTRLIENDLYSFYNNNTKRFYSKGNLNLIERQVLQGLRDDDSIIITSADKGGCIVLMDYEHYKRNVNQLLSDSQSYSRLNREDVLKKVHLVYDMIDDLLKSTVIDKYDLFLIWRGNDRELLEFEEYMNESVDFLSFTSNSSREFVAFLDVNIMRLDNGLVNTSIHGKKCYRNTLLHRDSMHPRHVFESVARSQSMRASRLNPSEEGFKLELDGLSRRLQERAYRIDEIKRAIDASIELRGTRACPYFSSQDLTILSGPGNGSDGNVNKKGDILSIPVYFTSDVGYIRRIIGDRWDVLRADDEIMRLVGDKPRFIYKNMKNIKRILQPRSVIEKRAPSYNTIPCEQVPIKVEFVESVQEDACANSEQGEEEMEVDSDNEDEEEKVKTGAFSSSVHSSLNPLRPGEIPDAAFIHAARKKRQLARELGDVPVDPEVSKGRLVREDEHDASDDDDEKRRIVFSVKEKSQRQKIAEEMGIDGTVDEVPATGEQDEEISMWEQEQIRKGISIPQVQSSPPTDVNMYYQNTYSVMPYDSSFAMPYVYAAYGPADAKQVKADSLIFQPPCSTMAPVTIDLVKNRLQERLESLRKVHNENQQQHEKYQQDLANSTKTIDKLEGSSDGIDERYRFLQELRGYVQDLIECFSEKVPVINELESAMHQLYKLRAARLVQRRQDDIKDESSEYSGHSSKATVPPTHDAFGRDKALFQEHAKLRRIAEREARRARRRQARELSGKMAEHNEGLSSDDEETSTDITNYNIERERILAETKKVFEDVLDDFSGVDSIKLRFEELRLEYYSHYREAYIALCLPRLFNPLVRLQLIPWNPLEAKCPEFENMLWFESLLFYGCEEQKELQKDDVDIGLLPAITEKVILPKLCVLAEHVWDPFSTSQTSRLVAFVKRLIGGYPSVIHAENKNTQALLKCILMRLRRTLDEDVFMPLYSKTVLDNKNKNSGPYLFFQRQFWSCVKLLGNILQWHGILSNRVLQELAIDSLLNRYMLISLQSTECGEDGIKKSKRIITCFPKQWFTSLKGDKTIPQLENFCRYLLHSATTIYRMSVTGSDADKRSAREQMKQIIKLLASIHAVDHAVAVANEHSVKDIKAVLEGK